MPSNYQICQRHRNPPPPRACYSLCAPSGAQPPLPSPSFPPPYFFLSWFQLRVLLPHNSFEREPYCWLSILCNRVLVAQFIDPLQLRPLLLLRVLSLSLWMCDLTYVLGLFASPTGSNSSAGSSQVTITAKPRSSSGYHRWQSPSCSWYG
jgi:hypothetical protein